MRRDWTRAEELRAVRLRMSGLKVSAIARRLLRPVGSVKQKLSRLGVVVAPFCRARRKPRGLMNGVRELTRRGCPPVEIAERLGVDLSAVVRARQRLGIPPDGASARTRRAWEFRRRKGVAA